MVESGLDHLVTVIAVPGLVLTVFSENFRGIRGVGRPVLSFGTSTRRI